MAIIIIQYCEDNDLIYSHLKTIRLHMNFKIITAGLFLILTSTQASQAQPLLEPLLTIKPGAAHGPYVALTLDACQGRVDDRILSALVDNHIRATIFVTARWLKYNAKAVEVFKAHPELFEIENHGAMHVPAVDVPMKVFGLAAAGSPQAVQDEIEGGAAAITRIFGHKPKWFRGATGMYTASSAKQITDLNLKLAGYSLRGDGGSSFSAKKTAATIENAKDGDVIIAHINQPKKSAGLGVVEGILKLKAKGFIFLRLQDGV
jgi:peptidoglycan/xylan/chitin deacetylase (PgdA/CDA1 family)